MVDALSTVGHLSTDHSAHSLTDSVLPPPTAAVHCIRRRQRVYFRLFDHVVSVVRPTSSSLATMLQRNNATNLPPKNMFIVCYCCYLVRYVLSTSLHSLNTPQHRHSAQCATCQSNAKLDKQHTIFCSTESTGRKR